MEKITSVNISRTKSKSLAFSILVLSIGLIAIIGQFSTVNCTLPYYDQDSNRPSPSLIDVMRSLGLNNDINFSGFSDSNQEQKEEQPQAHPHYHMLVRKGGRAPTLRLRFGRRSDPSWPPLLGVKSNSQESVN